MRGRPQPRHAKTITNADRRVEMMQFLYQCRPEKLADVTAADLSRRYHVSVADATRELAKAVEQRSAML